MILGKRGREDQESTHCAQVSMLCRQKLLGYAESFEQLGKSFQQECNVTGEDRRTVLEKCMLWESRQIMGDHLQEVARIMEMIAKEELEYHPLEEKLRHLLTQALREEGILARELCYVRNGAAGAQTENGRDGRRLQGGLSMTLSSEKSTQKASRVADILSVLTGKHLQPSPGSPYLVEKEPHSFLFLEEPGYIALTGVSRAVKEGERISGDQYALLESERGRITVLLSDGTGSGEDASRGSGRVMDLMEKMLEAGFAPEAALHMLNASLYARNEESDHPTLDLCSVDLYRGTCETCKVGGVATFFKTTEGVEPVGGQTLPLGIFQQIQPETATRTLQPGDMVVLMTDGVLDALEGDCEEEMTALIASIEEQNPQEIAERILAYAIHACGGRIRDDMTVFVLCLWNGV